MTRLAGWEEALGALIEQARAQPYVLGEHDCFRLACSVIEALTGVNRWPEFAGYRTRREALAKLAAHGSNFEAAGDWFFGAARVDVKLAQRGDLLAVQTADGEKHLGVCLGAETALLGPQGLVFMPTLAALCCWKVG